MENMIIKRNNDGFKIVRFYEDKYLRFDKNQNCYINECWVVVEKNEMNPVLISFYSIDKKRITDEEIYNITNKFKLNVFEEICNSKGCPILNICWSDYLPPCGMFLNGILSLTWKYYNII